MSALPPPAAMDPLPSNATELEQVLGAMLAPDTEAIARATRILVRFLKRPDSVGPMLQQMASSSQPHVRQEAAVLLRHKINSHWLKLPEQARNEYKALLLQRLATEPIRIVRTSVAALVSTLSKLTVAGNQWPELLDFLLQMSRAPAPEHREMAMMLFRALAENIGKPLKPLFKELHSIFTTGLGDPASIHVRVQAVRALEALVELLEPEDEQLILAYRSCIPPLVATLQQCLARAEHDEEASNAITVSFELFDALLLGDVPVLDNQLHQLVPFMLELATNRGISTTLRDNAVQFVVGTCANMSAVVVKHKLVESCVRASFMLCMEVVPDEVLDNWAELSPHQIGAELLEAVIEHLPRKLVLEPTLHNAVQATHSPNPAERKAGMHLLSTLSFGYPADVADRLDPLLERVLTCCKDPEAVVRASALYTLSGFCDNLKPLILEKHALFLPQIIHSFTSPAESWTVKRKALLALEALCEELDKAAIAPVLDMLVKQLVNAFQTAPDQRARVYIVSTLRAVASGSGENFVPYAEPVLALLRPLLLTEDEALFMLRSKATGAVGAIARAVGKERFKPFMQDYFHLVVSGTKVGSIELREAAHIFFESIARMLEKDFAVLLPTVLTLIFSSIETADGMVERSDNELSYKPTALDEEEDMSDEERIEADEHEEYDKVHVSIRVAALDEKISALNTLCVVIAVTEEMFEPYLNKTVERLGKFTEYPHEDIKEHLVMCFEEVIKLLANMYPSVPAGQPLPRGVITPMQPKPLAYLTQIVREIIDMMQDRSKSVVAQVCETLKSAVELFGLAAVNEFLDPLAKNIILMFQEKAPCQKGTATDDMDDAEHDYTLIDSAADLVDQLALSGGPGMCTLIEPLVPLLLKFMHPKRPVHDRSMAVGTFGEVAQALGPAFGRWVPQVLAPAIQAVIEGDWVLRRNAAFCVGTLCAVAPDQAQQYFNQAVEALQRGLAPIEADREKRAITDEQEYLGTKDNCISAICKIVVVNASRGVAPPPQLVAQILANLPFRGDVLENRFVYQGLLVLFASFPQVILPMLPRVIEVLSFVFANQEQRDSLNIEKEMNLPANLAHLVKSLFAQCGPQLQPMLAALPENQRNAIMQVAQS